MSHNSDEVIYLLHRAASHDAAVRALSIALEAQPQDSRYALKSIVYKSLSDRCGFTVTVHGVTLLPVYEHVLQRSSDYPNIFGRIHLCLPSNTSPGRIMVSLLVADTGDYSDDGTTDFGYSTYDLTGSPSDLCRHRLSIAIARAVQGSLPVLHSDGASVQCAKTDSLQV
ncbi:hypothetical protein [Paraburkholderia phytofirmans]|uniref:Uncharacterized protein n=1 Tax=Paraburkholderia phytofirmans TaxID=261302 RepID=A0ABW9BCA2_9BURK